MMTEGVETACGLGALRLGRQRRDPRFHAHCRRPAGGPTVRASDSSGDLQVRANDPVVTILCARGAKW